MLGRDVSYITVLFTLGNPCGFSVKSMTVADALAPLGDAETSLRGETKHWAEPLISPGLDQDTTIHYFNINSLSSYFPAARSSMASPSIMPCK